MERRLQPELLDSLPDGSPAARHSRRDLRILNRLLGSRRWFARILRRKLRPGERVLELGAGGGEIGAGLQARGFPVDGLDRCGRPAAWDARYRWHRTDLFAFAGWDEYPVVIANLFLHHLDATQLRWLGERLSSHARVVLTSEPLRCRLTGGVVRPRLFPDRGAPGHTSRWSCEHCGRVSPRRVAKVARTRAGCLALAGSAYRIGKLPIPCGETGKPGRQTGTTPMSPLRQIEIVGGGLTGLSLGLGLRQAGVPVTVFEAGDYPRHRVCGEFISGLDEAIAARLIPEDLLAHALRHREVRWYCGDRFAGGQRLPSAALGISRYTLDTRMAEEFVAAGGRLVTRTRMDPAADEAGRVWACGRRRASPSPWVGWKCHVRGLRLDGDLELHLGRRAYVGLCPVGEGWTNVCGLFHRSAVGAGSREEFLEDALRAAGLAALAARLETAERRPESECAVAGLAFGWPEPAEKVRQVELGDASAMIPPFTGHGMALAFTSASLAVDPLVAWAAGVVSWEDTARTIHEAHRSRFRRRFAVAKCLHPLLLHPAGQRLLVLLVRARAPFNAFYRLLR